jgi:hypothetical protein
MTGETEPHRGDVQTGGGDYAEGNIDKRRGVFVDIRVLPGDSPEVREAKLRRARNVAANEVLVNLGHLNAWLAYARAALVRDDVAPQMDALRRRIAPAAAAAASSGYHALMAAQHVASLRQAFNGRPISRELSLALVDVLAEAGAAGELRFFVDQLAAVQDAAESLLGALTAVADTPGKAEEVRRHYAARRDLALRVLANRARMAYLAGQRALAALAVPIEELQPRLDALDQFEPRRPLSPDEIIQLLTAALADAEGLMQERAAFVVEAERLVADSLQSYAELEELLTIQPGDPWNVVVGKARSLRDLGRTTDAVAAFARYADMFAAGDPGARDYARAAQQLTLQLATLGIQGAVYLYELVPGGAAEQAGLQQGDVVVGYGERSIGDMPDLVTALQESVVGTRVRVTFLRLDAQGHFARGMATIAGGPPGAGFLPI